MAPKHSPRFLKIVDESRKRVRELNVDEVKAKASGDGPIRMKDFQLTSEVMGLALRASVQLGKIEDAKTMIGYYAWQAAAKSS